MAKKVTGYIKLQIPAGKATPAPPTAVRSSSLPATAAKRRCCAQDRCRFS